MRCIDPTGAELPPIDDKWVLTQTDKHELDAAMASLFSRAKFSHSHAERLSNLYVKLFGAGL